MTMVLCVAGGSGSGKSTLADNLSARFGRKISVLRLDDYQKHRDQCPRTGNGRPNYDHPEALALHRFVEDLGNIVAGRSVRVLVPRKNATMDAGVSDDGWRTIEPAPILLVEGYLALWPIDARPFYDFSVFLTAPDDLRLARRRWAKDPGYVAEVLVPMHRLFIEPTSVFADLVIDVSILTPEQVTDQVIDRVPFLRP